MPNLILKYPTALAILLAALAMLGPFSIDAYLPAFPAMQASLPATALQVQQTLSVYMLCFALMMLLHGALSDAFGRRKVILWSLLIFTLASLACAVAPNIHTLWLCRALQGASAGAGLVVGRAIIRDLHAGSAAERLLSLVTMIFSIAPAIAPMIGGWVVTYSGWRTIFFLLSGFGAILYLCSQRFLPESLEQHKQQRFNLEFLWKNYSRVFTSSGFYCKAGALAFNFGGLFLYVSAAPVFITQHLKLGAQQFGWQFVPMVSGIFLGALAANRLSGKVPGNRIVSLGLLFMIGAASFNVAYHFVLQATLPWSVLALFFYNFGMSMVSPTITVRVLDLFPEVRGIAASCQSAMSTLFGALVAGLIAPLLDYSALSLASGQLFFALCSATLWYSGLLAAARRFN